MTLLADPLLRDAQQLPVRNAASYPNRGATFGEALAVVPYHLGVRAAWRVF